MGVRYLNTPRKRLGDYLVELGFISQEQLQVALKEQREKGGKLGTILLQMGFLSEDILLAILGKQSGVSYVSLSEYGDIPPEAIKSVPEAIARTQVLIPIKKEGNLLTIAISDPLNVFATDDLKLLTGCDIRMVVASDGEIHEALERYYGHAAPKPDAEKAEAAAQVAAPAVEFVGESVFEGEKDSGASAEKLISMMLSEAVAKGATDIHIEPQESKMLVRFRINGKLEHQPSPPKRIQVALTARLKSLAGLDPSEQRTAQSGIARTAVAGKDIYLRVTFMPALFGETVVLKLPEVDDAPLHVDRLGMPDKILESLKRNLRSRGGLILIAGPSDSGRSTTAHAALASLDPAVTNIMTIEDPIERTLEGANQVQVRPELGLTFGRAMRFFMRQDADAIFVGELNDRETANLAAEAALAGRLVIAALHANDVTGAISRMIELGADPAPLATAIRLVISQRVLRRVCPTCSEEYMAPGADVAALGAKVGVDQKVELRRGKGCEACKKTGFNGRVAVYQGLEINDDLRHLIVRRAPTADIRLAAARAGAEPLRRAALEALLAGRTSIGEVTRTTGSEDPGVMK